MIREQSYILKKWLWPCGLCGARYNQKSYLPDHSFGGLLECSSTNIYYCGHESTSRILCFLWRVTVFKTFTMNLKSIQDKIFHFFSWFQLLSKTISEKTTYGNPLSFGLYNNSQRWEMIKFVKEKGEISQFSCLSRYKSSRYYVYTSTSK